MHTQANSFHIIVKIDKKLQLEKREKIGSIYISPIYEYMKYFLQWGPIIDMGDTVKEHYPYLEIGDILLFHHTIEQDEWRLLDTDDNGDEYRIVIGKKENFNFEIYGAIKPDTTIVPDLQYIFISSKMTALKHQITSTILDVKGNPFFEDEDYYNKKISECEMVINNMKETAENNPDNPVLMQEILKSIIETQNEMSGYTRKMNEKKLVSVEVVGINDDLSRQLDIHVGTNIVVNKTELYPMDVNGQKLLLANKDFVLGKIIES